MLYELVRPLLFGLDAETAHDLTIRALAGGQSAGLLRPRPLPAQHVRVMGLDFPNRVGLAAGLDKNGAAIDGLAALGFGHVEIGTVTPRAQPGNPRPRLFRLPEQRAIINRMGFNNLGVDNLVANVRRSRFVRDGGILGINIGKNFDTPIERAADDYLACLQKVYPYASYVTINISSPNTKNLRQLQGENELDALLAALAAARANLTQALRRRVPLALKIAPDLDDAQIDAIAQLLLRHGMDAVIATNTTLSRVGVEHARHGGEAGGLSGSPVFAPSTAVVSKLAARLRGEIPILGVGGITDGATARAKLAAGASLVQLYSGLIYRGPDLVKESVRATDIA
ncbi:MAG: quinone-dependent dihydroorotate dehydrogenase [Rhodocyclaceae bacterium]|nr:quinone-dependent dihydroorotate dehydrogenase [Rhodocyclaceae bacterium]MBX3668043.1 quinone-dependent dihydroorotate dehydrogenase [Rhodocyclaceae bacterium]